MMLSLASGSAFARPEAASTSSGQARRVTLGSTSQLTADAARTKASRILLEVRTGTDPQADRFEAIAKAGDTFRATAERYLTRQKTVLREKSYTAIERYLLTHFAPLHRLPLARIDRRTIAERLSEIAITSGPAAANRARATLSAFFTWATKEGLVDSNPVIATNRHGANKPRERVLTMGEIAEIWRASGEEPYGSIVKLLILTGQRRTEIGSLRWSEIDFVTGLIRLPGERCKNHRPHDIPLSDPAMQMLQATPRVGEFVFGTTPIGFSPYADAKHDLDERIAIARGPEPMPPWVLHDLRRSVATHMAEIGVQPHIVEAVLNHISGHKSGVAGIYNRATYAEEKRQALCRWADHLMTVIEGRPLSVVPTRNQA
jgi:integrase